MLKRQMLTWAAAAVALAGTTTTVPAADIFWQGGDGAVDAANYYKPSTGETGLTPPTASDFAYVGNGTVTLSDSQTIVIPRIRIGHNFTDGGTIAPAGPATFNVTGGSLTLAGTTVGSKSNDTEGSAGALIIGYNQSGAVNISGGSVTLGRYVSVGLDNTNDAIDNVPGATATLNISGTGALAITHATNLASTVFVGNGVPGSVTISDSGSLIATSTGVGLQVGVTSPASYTQTGGTTTMTNGVSVGLNSVANASLALSGNTSFNVGGALTIGSGSATGTTWTIADNAHVSVGTNGTNNVFIGRGTSANTTFNMTGGTLDITKYFLMGTAAAGTSTATNIVANHSGGTITTASNFVLSDVGGDSTYNLSGAAVVNAGGTLLVGRRNAVAVFNQTGGAASAAVGLHIGDQQPPAGSPTDPALNATGTYNLSGGTLAATVPDGSAVDALAVAPGGTGTLHVIGGDATASVTGNLAVYANTSGSNVGTLAYTLEPGESLTEINVTGTATFSLGSVLSFDLNGTTPAQSSFDLLTAADIVDNGLSFSAPTGWNFQIVPGGNGEVLQAFTMATVHHPGDTNNDGVVDLTDLNNVLNNFGSAGTGNPGDDDSSGVVDLTDLNNVLNNFGTTYAAAALNVVPEPASLSLLALGAAALLGRRRRR